LKAFFLRGVIFILCAVPVLVFAQVYRWTDDKGSTHYGDKPPAGAHDIERLEGVVKGAKRDPQAALPYQLQSTIRDFPVTLYTMAGCAGCNVGRSLQKNFGTIFPRATVSDIEVSNSVVAVLHDDSSLACTRLN